MATYRRVKYERVKQWAKKGALVAVPTLSLLFLFLVSLDAIAITGYSGDQICAGTPDDSCYAYINFTAKTDVYIYPNESWYFYTDVPIKNIKIQRSWGTTWRTIDLTKPWSSKVKYAVKFRKGIDYRIRFVAEKYSPYDSIKWGFTDSVDPTWLPMERREGQSVVAYTKNTKTITKPDGSKTIISGFKTAQKWDGSYIPEASLDINSGDWRYLVEDRGNQYLITRRGESFRIPKMDGIVFEEKQIIVPEVFNSPAELSGKLKGLVMNKHLKYETGLTNAKVIDNIVYIGSEFWSERVVVKDNGTKIIVNGTEVLNYSYVYPKVDVVNGEVRIYLDIKDLEKMSFPVKLHAPTWITNSSTGWNGELTNVVEYGNGRIKLNHNQTGIISWWDYSENTGATAYDYTDNSKDGTLTDMESGDWQTGKYGTALNFGGDDDYVTYPADQEVNATNDITWTFWVNATDDWNDAHTDYGIFDTGGVNNEFHALLKVDFTSDSLQYVTVESGIQSVFCAKTDWNAGQWYHIALVHNSSNSVLWYVDGVLDDTDSFYPLYTSFYTQLDIGRRHSADTPTYFKGVIDEFMIFNRSLSISEIVSVRDGQTRYLTGNYTELDYDCGNGNIAQNISVHFVNSSTNTKMNVYVNMSTDNITWDSSYTLVQAGALNATEYTISSGERYIKYRTELNTTTGAETDEMYEVRVECVASADVTPPTVTWYNQTNSTGDEVDIDINTRRLLNLTWNLTDASPINISSCSIQVRVNDTTLNDTNWLYENDTLSSNLDAGGWWTHSCVLAYNNSDNTSISVYAELQDSLRYRATSLAIPISDIADNTTDPIYKDHVVMFKNSNATIHANYIYVTKHYLNSKVLTTADSRLWYCNLTYATGGWGDYRTNPSCIIAASIHENDTKDGGSNYFERYGSADENSTFGGVKITDPSYFITDSIDAKNANQGWEITGTSGHSGHSYTSDDYGVTWTLKPDTEFDMIIQWFNAQYFEARVNITDNEGNNVVDLRTDYFDTANRAPEAAFKKDCASGGLLTVYNECNITECGTLNVSADFLDPDANLVNCTFILLNNDSSYNQTLSEIETNVSYGVCSVLYDTTALTDGDYNFKVNVTDGLLIGSDTTYDFIRIDNTAAVYNLTEGENTKSYTTSGCLINSSIPVWVNFTNKKEFRIESNFTENINLTAFLNVTKCTVEKATYYTNGTWRYYKEGDDGYNCTNSVMTIYLALISPGRSYVHPLYEGLGR